MEELHRLAQLVNDDPEAYSTVVSIHHHPIHPRRFFVVGGTKSEVSALSGIQSIQIQKINTDLFQRITERLIFPYLTPGSWVGCIRYEPDPRNGASVIVQSMAVVAPTQFQTQCTPEQVALLVVPHLPTRSTYDAVTPEDPLTTSQSSYIAKQLALHHGLQPLIVNTKQTYLSPIGPTFEEYAIVRDCMVQDIEFRRAVSESALLVGRGDRLRRDCLVKIMAGKYLGHTAFFKSVSSTRLVQQFALVALDQPLPNPPLVVRVPASYLRADFRPLDRVRIGSGRNPRYAYIHEYVPETDTYLLHDEASVRPYSLVPSLILTVSQGNVLHFGPEQITFSSTVVV